MGINYGPDVDAVGVLRRDLTELANEAVLDETDYIADRLFPAKAVKNPDGRHPIIKIEEYFKVVDTIKKPGGGYARSGLKLGTATFSCSRKGYEEEITEEDRALYKDYFDVELIAMERALDQMRRSKEVRAEAVAMDTAVITTTQAAASAWSVKASAVPRADSLALQVKMWNNRGIKPNVAVMAYSLLKEALNSDSVSNKMQYTGTLELMPMKQRLKALAMFLDVEEILVGMAQKDTANKGLTAVVSEIWPSNKVGLYKVAKTADLKEVALGRSFWWEEIDGEQLAVDSYREENKEQDIIRVKEFDEQTLMFAGAGGIITGV